MLGIDNELEQLYQEAQQTGSAVIKDRWTARNYGCCSTRAPLVEKYKIKLSAKQQQLFIWGTIAVTVDLSTQTASINPEYEGSNYDQRIIDWFVQKAN